MERTEWRQTRSRTDFLINTKKFPNCQSILLHIYFIHSYSQSKTILWHLVNVFLWQSDGMHILLWKLFHKDIHIMIKSIIQCLYEEFPNTSL